MVKLGPQPGPPAPGPGPSPLPISSFSGDGKIPPTYTTDEGKAHFPSLIRPLGEPTPGMLWLCSIPLLPALQAVSSLPQSWPCSQVATTTAATHWIAVLLIPHFQFARRESLKCPSRQPSNHTDDPSVPGQALTYFPVYTGQLRGWVAPA